MSGTYGGLGRHIEYGWALARVTQDPVEDKMRVMERSGLYAITLRSFIQRWSEELNDYYGEDFGSETHIIDDAEFGNTMVFVMADLRDDIDPAWVPNHVRKKFKKAGKWRRDKLKHQWSYANPLNRIHGFLILKDVTNRNHTKRTMSIDTVCSSYFTDRKGIGSDLMVLAKEFSEELGAFDIVLEVANEFSGMGIPDDDCESMDLSDEDEDEDDEDDEEDEDEDYADEDDDDEDEDDDDEDDEEEVDTVWYPDEDVLSILADELWKKCMRKDESGHRIYYNLDQEYIEAGLWDYFYFADENRGNTELWEGTEKHPISDKDEPKDSEYGGFWYLKGKRSQSALMKFYEKFGFKEDPEVHSDWCIFSDIPFPTMRLSLE